MMSEIFPARERTSCPAEFCMAHHRSARDSRVRRAAAATRGSPPPHDAARAADLAAVERGIRIEVYRGDGRIPGNRRCRVTR